MYIFICLVKIRNMCELFFLSTHLTWDLLLRYEAVVHVTMRIQ